MTCKLRVEGQCLYLDQAIISVAKVEVCKCLILKPMVLTTLCPAASGTQIRFLFFSAGRKHTSSSLRILSSSSCRPQLLECCRKRVARHMSMTRFSRVPPQIWDFQVKQCVILIFAEIALQVNLYLNRILKQKWSKQFLVILIQKTWAMNETKQTNKISSPKPLTPQLEFTELC